MAREMTAISSSEMGIGVKITDPDDGDRLIGFVPVGDTIAGEAMARNQIRALLQEPEIEIETRRRTFQQTQALVVAMKANPRA